MIRDEAERGRRVLYDPSLNGSHLVPEGAAVLTTSMAAVVTSNGLESDNPHLSEPDPVIALARGRPSVVAAGRRVHSRRHGHATIVVMTVSRGWLDVSREVLRLSLRGAEGEERFLLGWVVGRLGPVAVSVADEDADDEDDSKDGDDDDTC